MISDAFIHANESEYLIDVHHQSVDVLLSHLIKYKLRNDVSISPTDKRVSFSRTGTSTQLDPRSPLLHYRTFSPTADAITEEEYTKLRVENTIPEFPYSVPEGCLPLDHSLHHLNAIDFRKGCYLGQELTTRTHHTGVLRKCVVKLTFDGMDSSKEQDIMCDGKKVGRFYERYGCFGIGMMKIDCVGKALGLEDGTGVKAELPGWMKNI